MHPVLRSTVEAVAIRAQRDGATALALLRLFAGEVRAALLRVFAYGVALGALGMGVAEFMTGPGGTVTQRAPQRDWIEVARPYPAFALSLPEYDEASRYAIQRHASGGGRKDIFTFGDPGASAIVEIYRPGSEAEQSLGRAEHTASIPDLRLSAKPVAPRAIDTKFGPVALEDQTADGVRRCLHFARSFDEPRLEISGRFCNAGLELVDRGIVACALDRLTLLAAGSDSKLGALFARAELKRSFCGHNSVFVAATPKRAGWLEAARDPKLRGGQ